MMLSGTMFHLVGCFRHWHCSYCIKHDLIGGPRSILVDSARWSRISMDFVGKHQDDSWCGNQAIFNCTRGMKHNEKNSVRKLVDNRLSRKAIEYIKQRFNGKLREIHWECGRDRERGEPRNLIQNNIIHSVHRMCSESTFIQTLTHGPIRVPSVLDCS